MGEQLARQAEQKLAQLPPSEQQRVTQNEDTLAQWISKAVAGHAAYDVIKSAAKIIISRGRKR